VVEVCNINFSNSLSSEEIKAILNVPNPEVNAVRCTLLNSEKAGGYGDKL